MNSRSWAAGISMLAVLPWLILKLIFLSNVQGWSSALAYGLIVLIVPAGIIALCVFLGVESHLRSKHLPGYRRFPWFTPLAAIGLLTFFFVGEWAKPVVMQNPRWCRVNQVLEWTTSNDRRFILVLIGRGNITEHEFSTAYLNWSGDGSAGIPTIKLKPIRFGWWNGNTELFVDGTPIVLRQRIAGSGLPDEQLDSLTAEIWDVLNQANEGRTISSSNAQVGRVWDAPFGNEHSILGGFVWMIVLTLLFQIVGQITLREPAHK